MSRDAASFARTAPGVTAAESVREGEFIHRYAGTLAEHTESVRFLVLAPDIDERGAATAFEHAANQWATASTHRNIVSVYDRDDDPRPWMAVEDIPGRPLDTAQSELSAVDASTLVSDVAGALRIAALYNTSHLDLHPTDIWVVRDDEGVTGVVGGWGLERAVRTAVDDPEVTPFTAPEVVADPAAADERTDVYGLGGLTYYALTGQPPVDTGSDVAAAIRDGDVVPPSDIDGSLSSVDAVVMQALAVDPSDRQESAYSFRQSFERAFSPAAADEVRTRASTAAGPSETRSSSDVGGDPKDAGSADDDPVLTTRRAVVAVLGIGVAGVGSDRLLTRTGGGGDPVDSAAAPVETDTTSTPTSEPLPEPTQRWTFSTGGEVASSPAVAGGAVYIGSDDGNVYALDAADGTERWTFETADLVQSSPVVASDTVYVGSWADDGNLYAIDATDGTERWSFQTNGVVSSAPAVVDGTVYVENTGTLFALSAADGTPKWRYDTGEEVNSQPTVVDGRVYIGSFVTSGEGRVYALSAADGTEQWTFETGGAVYSAPAVRGDTVYIGSQVNVYALDATSGAERWSFRSGIYSSPAVVGETVYVGGDAVYALDTADGTARWEFPMGKDVRTSPAVAGDTVYVGTPFGVYALATGDGSGRWSLQTSGRIDSSPAVVGGTVYVGGTDGTVLALDAANADQQMVTDWPMFGYDAANTGAPR